MIAEDKLDVEKPLDLAFRLVSSLRMGDMKGVAYDTAWIARCVNLPSPLQSDALDWLLKNQLSDGSWGGVIEFSYDRIISTISSLIALSKSSIRSAEDNIVAGICYLPRSIDLLPSHKFDDTVGFELIVPELFREGKEIGLAIPELPPSVSITSEMKNTLLGQISKKQAKILYAFSLEMFGTRSSCKTMKEYLGKDGSVASSPSATAYIIDKGCKPLRKTLNYLNRASRLNSDGSFPAVYPFEIFETAWVLYNLHIGGIHPRKFPKQIRALSVALDERKTTWSKNIEYQDLDDLAIVYSLLLDAGYEVNPHVFEAFESKDHFVCFPGERVASIGANCHLLHAIARNNYFENKRHWIAKLRNYIMSSRISNAYWLDKWHISPYYGTTQAIIALSDIGSYESISSSIDWILETQRDNGLWGFSNGNQEETAYALQGILYAYIRKGSAIPKDLQEKLREPIKYLYTSLEKRQEFPEMWLAKVLFSPRNIIHSTILSAIFLHNNAQQIMSN